MGHTAVDIVRIAKPSDAERVGEIAVSAWKPIFSAYREVLGEAIFISRFGNWEAKWRSAVKQPTEENRLFVAEVDHQLVGYASFWIDPTRARGEVAGNAVIPEWQGQGIGSALCRRVMDEFSRRGLVYARVHTGADIEHKPARRQYERMGFHRAIEYSDFYFETGDSEYITGDPEDGEKQKAALRWDYLDWRNYRWVLKFYYAMLEDSYENLCQHVVGRDIYLREFHPYRRGLRMALRSALDRGQCWGLWAHIKNRPVAACLVEDFGLEYCLLTQTVFTGGDSANELMRLLLRRVIQTSWHKGMKFVVFRSTIGDNLTYLRSSLRSVGPFREIPFIQYYTELPRIRNGGWGYRIFNEWHFLRSGVCASLRSMYH